eukprot:CAMPEP_0113700456 /NCGR_PEP_ID=MMETSP0038_2-20120614/23967_1 /TAXON_ID=2898 /ORGANISM="Cryptomonas paramecium" /LENGTH=113 /DNA_ID=CAMNT_0000624115 /DNA_START=70 /DNA_END=408 /DNA_ORIENTATION=- /assembly_acc=CAM_ASM_000170
MDKQESDPLEKEIQMLLASLADHPSGQGEPPSAAVLVAMFANGKSNEAQGIAASSTRGMSLPCSQANPMPPPSRYPREHRRHSIETSMVQPPSPSRYQGNRRHSIATSAHQRL